MAKIIIPFIVLFSLKGWSQQTVGEADYQEIVQASRLVVGFLDNGLTAEEVFADGNSCSNIHSEEAIVERVRCEERLIRQAEAASAVTVANQLPINDCRGPVMIMASVSAFERSRYNRGQGSVMSRETQRARSLYRAIINHCPNSQLGFENVLPYINGEDLFSLREIVDGVRCNQTSLYRLGHWFRGRQDQTLVEYSQVQRHTYYDSETQRRLFEERNQRLNQIQSAIEEKCGLALERNTEMEQSYSEGAVPTSL